MNIGVLFNPFKNITGIPSVVINCMSELLEIDNRDYFFAVKGTSQYVDIDGPSQIYCESGMKFQNLWLKSKKMDVLYSFYPAFDDIRCGQARTILTIHDMIPLLYPQWFNETSNIYFDKNIRASVQIADLIVAVSESTKKDVVNSYGIPEEKVRVIYNGLHSKIDLKCINTGIIEKNGINSRFLLSVCTIEPRKNLRGLIKAFKIYKERNKDDDLKLVVAGGKGWDSSFFSWLEEQGDISKDIIITGYVSDSELSELYSKSLAVAYVSFYEGFGLPILEGLALGKAVISSDQSSMPEVGGNAVCYCNPYEVESIANAIEKVVNDDDYRKILEVRSLMQASKFSYKNAAKDILDVINELA